MQALTRVELVSLFPTPAGCAVFLGDGQKAILFYIDPGIGSVINATMIRQAPLRPMTHDLLLLTLQAFGATVSRVVIVRMENEVYYARLILDAANEIMERKIVELDARPSDCLALMVRTGAPFYVVTSLWQQLEDMTHTLHEMRRSAEDGNEGTSD